MQTWTPLHEDQNIEKIEEELQVKQKQCEETLVTIKYLSVLQKLASITR